MGVLHVPVTLKAVGGTETYTASFLVDTGSTDSVAPASALRAIGLQPLGTIAYELADGTQRELPFSIAHIEIMGRVTGGRVVFGPEGCEPIAGVTVIESIGLAIDPARQTLKLLPAVRL